MLARLVFLVVISQTAWAYAKDEVQVPRWPLDPLELLTPNRTAEIQSREIAYAREALRANAVKIESDTTIQVVDDYGRVKDPIETARAIYRFSLRNFGNNAETMRGRYVRSYGLRLGLAMFRVYLNDKSLEIIDGAKGPRKFSVDALRSEICDNFTQEQCTSLVASVYRQFEAKYADWHGYLGVALLDDYGDFNSPSWIFHDIVGRAFKNNGDSDITLRRVFMYNWGIDCGLALYRFWLRHKANFIIPKSKVPAAKSKVAHINRGLIRAATQPFLPRLLGMLNLLNPLPAAPRMLVVDFDRTLCDTPPSNQPGIVAWSVMVEQRQASFPPLPGARELMACRLRFCASAVVLSSRSEALRAVTAAWLREHMPELSDSPISLRAVDDERSPSQSKGARLAALRGDLQVELMDDDRDMKEHLLPGDIFRWCPWFPRPTRRSAAAQLLAGLLFYLSAAGAAHNQLPAVATSWQLIRDESHG